MDIFYAGIGSRETPSEVLVVMEKLGAAFGKMGLVLRSGHAPGADQAFEKGCDSVKGAKEIYLPWKGFEGSNSELYNHPGMAEEIAFQYHPNLYKCSDGVIKLMTRNSCQVLGKDCKLKSNFIVCYCEIDELGKWKGGTAQALRIASDKKIPIFNLFYKEDLGKLKEYLATLKVKNETSQNT
jgi:hypothetical protein